MEKLGLPKWRLSGKRLSGIGQQFCGKIDPLCRFGPEKLPLRRLQRRRRGSGAYTLIETAKLNGVDPQAWLTSIFKRIADHKITQLNELLP